MRRLLDQHGLLLTMNAALGMEVGIVLISDSAVEVEVDLGTMRSCVDGSKLEILQKNTIYRSRRFFPT